MASYHGRNGLVVYSIGKRLGGGGEGEVYEISGNRGLVAKVYYDSKFNTSAVARQDLREKIETMLDQPVDPYINGVLSVAWPQDVLLDQHGRFVGYTMPRVKSDYHIFAASRERERIVLYPNYTWKTAILIAYNLALAVKKVHASNAVIGDMNPNNIMLDGKGHITLIDTDSYNITNKRTGKVYKCSVGVEEMLPPELQGRDLSKPDSRFTKQTDSFALAIHIFNLLMNNCHPFGCSGLTKSHASSSLNPVVSNISKGYCPYISGNGKKNPAAPDFMMLPKEIRMLFDNTFNYTAGTAVKANTIAKRPSAEEWQKALWNLYNAPLKECKKSKSEKHVYPKEYGKCPWCGVQHAVNTYVQSSNHTTGKAPSAQTPAASNAALTPCRKAWPLWLCCLLIGILSSPVTARYIIPFCYNIFDYVLPYTAAVIILSIIGGGSGAFIAHCAQSAYEFAARGWTWLLLGFLTPILTMVVAMAIVLVLFVIIIVARIMLYILGGALVLAFICGVCADG